MNKENKQIDKKAIETYDIANSYETLHLAQDLARFIKENKLFHNIHGKAYVNVEGWQYAGARLGILPVIEQLTNISNDKEIKYIAEVKLLDLKSQQVTGSGFAICSNLESGKRNYQEFAIASMAQTRAIGKAYRNILAWIIRAAGYEPTPAEEMDYMRNDDQISSVESPEDRAPLSKKQVKPENEAENIATVKQKTEILLLLNNKVIRKEEKDKMIENINKLTEDRAGKAIKRLKKVIDERQDVKSHAA
ncbi:MAG: hypothetical protein ACLFUB_02735 [Cyclobacteriaceae bacterium]